MIVAEPQRWLGETIGFWIQTVMLAVSAIAGIWIIVSRGNQERRRATVDLIVDQRRDVQLNQARTKIKEMHERGETNLARHLEKTDSDEYKAIMLELNAYEFIASGIRAKAFREGVYKRLRFSTVEKDWEAFIGFVIEFRKKKGKATFFQDFEWLYKRWKRKPLKSDP